MSQQNNHKRVLWLLGCGTATLVLVLAGGWAIWGWQETKLPPPPKLPPKSQTKDVASFRLRPRRDPPGRRCRLPHRRGPGRRIGNSTFHGRGHQSGLPAEVRNLEKMTSLRADLEEVRLKVAIAQEKEKLLPKQPAPASRPR